MVAGYLPGNERVRCPVDERLRSDDDLGVRARPGRRRNADPLRLADELRHLVNERGVELTALYELSHH